MAAAGVDPQDASAITRALNRAVLDALPFADTRDFDDARRGFLGSLPEVEIKNDAGRVVWTLRDYAFLADPEAAHRQSESLASGAAQSEPRPVPRDGPHLPGARLRHLEHDPDRG